MNRLFLIDFENVGLNGLTGIENLDSTDTVMIFSGVKSPKLSLEEANRIYNSSVKVNIFMNSQPRKNALDFIISSYLGYSLGKGIYQEHIIISKDKGYEPAIEAMKKICGEKIYQEKDILSAINGFPEKDTKSFSHASVHAQKDDLLQMEDLDDLRVEFASLEEDEDVDDDEVISQAIQMSSSKVEFHNMLQSILHDAQKATELYNRVKNKVNWDKPKEDVDDTSCK